MKKVPEDDPWMQNPFRGNTKKLHAIGVITVHWGECEMLLADVLAKLTRMDNESARIICIEIGSRSLQDKILELANRRRLSLQTRALLAHTLKFFELCRTNRNRYAHAMPHSEAKSVVTLGTNKRQTIHVTVGLLASRKRGTMQITQLEDSVEEIRAVADEIAALRELMMETISRLQYGRQSSNPTRYPIPPLPRNRQSPAKRTPGSRQPRPTSPQP